MKGRVVFRSFSSCRRLIEVEGTANRRGATCQYKRLGGKHRDGLRVLFALPSPNKHFKVSTQNKLSHVAVTPFSLNQHSL